MRLIDADVLKKNIENYRTVHLSHKRLSAVKREAEEVISDICFGIDCAPTVEVTRCRDCWHWHDDGYCNKWDNGPGHPEVWENDFCSFGERREE